MQGYSENNPAFYMEKIMKKIYTLFKSLPVVLTAVIGGFLLLKGFISIEAKSFLYATSLSIKDILVFLMPLIITSSMITMLVDLGKSSFLFVLKFIIIVCGSNFLSTFIAYGVGTVALPHFSHITSLKLVNSASLSPLWNLHLPTLIGNDIALLIGIILGVTFSIKRTHYTLTLTDILRKSVSFFLKRLFIPIVPLFILGFIIKLDYDNLLSQILNTQGATLLTIFMTQYGYILFLYLLAAEFNAEKFKAFIKNVLPSGVTAFCTMSSAATIPVTLQAAEKNTNNASTSRAIVVGTANIHLIGDSIGVPLMAMAILISFKFNILSFPQFLYFAFHFVIAKFCIAAVPGGGIIVMIPVMEQCLGFSSEMSALISAFYIMFDPINTAANVLGNGAFTILFSKFTQRVKKTPEIFSPVPAT